MSSSSAGGRGTSTGGSSNFEVRQSADHLNQRRILIVAGGSLVIGAIAIVVAWGLVGAWGGEERRGTPPAAPRTIGILEQTLIQDTARGIDLRRSQEAELRRWQWIDRDAGIAQIPIETAIDLMATSPSRSEPQR